MAEVLGSGQQLWAEACSLGSPFSALGSLPLQQYVAALGHVRFAASAVDAALCCGALSAPSVEAELCRALSQCEDAWQQCAPGGCRLCKCSPDDFISEHAEARSERWGKFASLEVPWLKSSRLYKSRVK